MNMYCFALVVILLATLASTDAANYTALNRFLCKDFWDCKECSKIKNEGKCNTGYFSGVCYKTCTGCGPYEKDKVANCALIAKEGKCFVRETVSPFVTPATRCETSCCTGVIALPKPSKPYWGDWSYWSSCSKTCNGGNRKRTRTCHADDDSPYCIGYSTEFQQCYQKISCNKVDGGWDEWSKWSSCQTTCGLGRKYRTRSCSSPWPTVNGKPCSGTSQTFKSCYAGCCPGAGVWGTWSSWSSCSQSCSYDGSKGKQERRRLCNNPAPYCGGPPCQGGSRQTQDCGAPCLPISKSVPTWSTWSNWASCSKTCSYGYRKRVRSCIVDGQENNGYCSGNKKEFEWCNKNIACPNHR